MYKSFRAALSKELEKCAKLYPDLVVLNADCARALQLSNFTKRFPDRMICVGISEADMLTTAAGLSAAGMLPVVVGFSMFTTAKPFEQIRQAIAYPNLNVKIIATHAGLCVGKDGATHQILEDIAIMRTLPNFKIFVAADVSETSSAISAMLLHDGPAYLRLGRDMAQDIFEEGKDVKVGGSDVLRQGKDVAIVACGLMVEQSLKAAEILKADGIDATVINAYSLKPLDSATIIQKAKENGAVITAEDHSIIGGLGGAVAELLASSYPVPMEFVGVKDLFGESGEQDELYRKYGLTAEDIAKAALRAMDRKDRSVQNV